MSDKLKAPGAADKATAAARRVKVLTRIVYLLAAMLGICELGITSRISEVITYQQLGDLGTAYLFALLAGTLFVPVLARIPSLKVRAAITILTAALPIVAIGIAVNAMAAGTVFLVIIVAWPVSGFGSGLLENIQGTEAAALSQEGAHHGVGSLAARHAGTFLATCLVIVTKQLHLSPGTQFIVLGVGLALSVVIVRWVRPGEAHHEEPKGRPASPWLLVPFGLFNAAGVAPISLTWAWTEPMMRELHADHTWVGAIALNVFVVSQATACVVYLVLTSREVSRYRLAVVGAVLAVAGAALVAVAAVERTSATPLLALVGMAILGWGIAPVPMIGIGHIAGTPMRFRTPTRIAFMVAIQASTVAIVSALFGHAASGSSAFGTYAVTVPICAAVLLITVRPLLGRRSRA